MHVYTLVITAGPRRSAVARADALLDAAVPRGFDYWRTGGWFSDRLAAERPEFDETSELETSPFGPTFAVMTTFNAWPPPSPFTR